MRTKQFSLHLFVCNGVYALSVRSLTFSHTLTTHRYTHTQRLRLQSYAAMRAYCSEQRILCVFICHLAWVLEIMQCCASMVRRKSGTGQPKITMLRILYIRTSQLPRERPQEEMRAKLLTGFHTVISK